MRGLFELSILSPDNHCEPRQLSVSLNARELFTVMFGSLLEKRSGFERVSGSDDQDELLNASERSSLESQSRTQTARGLSWVAAGIAIVCTAILSAVLGALAVQYGRLDADAFSIRHTSQYCKSQGFLRIVSTLTSVTAPIVGDVGVKYHQVRFEGSLMKPNNFKLDAGPEVDAAWKSLGADYHAARVPAEQAARSNLAPDQVKIKEEYGGGYPAHVEGLHHLHCLVGRVSEDREYR